MAGPKLWRNFASLTICLLALNSFVEAQLPQTRLYSLFPNGGQIGTEFEVTIASGADLDEVSDLVFSNPKITAKQKTTDQNGKAVPVANTFIVNIPADVEDGVYEARCGGLFGYSNPRRFAVDRFVATADPGDNNSAEKAAPLGLGQVVNGRLESGNDVDWFRVSAKQGDQVVFDVWADRLDSRMNPVIAVFDSTGRRRFEWSRNTVGFDPVLVFDVPADGDYCLQVRDLTFRNGAEYVYRLQAHTQPHLEFAWPPSATAGTKANIQLFGYNLPGGQRSGQVLNGAELESLTVQLDVPAQPDFLDAESRVRPFAAAMDAMTYRFAADGVVSNPIQIGLTALPVTAEVEPNNEAAAAQSVTVPIEIGGQFGSVEDTDLFRFEAKAGEVYYVDVAAQRLGGSTDAFLVVNQVIKKEDGTEEIKRLTAQDDVATTLLPNVFETKTDDPVFRLQVPADGTYEVLLRDRYWESRGDPSLRYSLSIRKETPDFRVVAVPAAPAAGQTWPTSLRHGDQFGVNLLAFRQDGFNGAIEVTAENLPEGMSCPPVVIGPGVTSTALTLISTSATPVGLHEIHLKAKARIEDPVLARALPEHQKAVDAAAKPVTDLKKKLSDSAEKTKAPLAEYQQAVQAAQADGTNTDLMAKAQALKAALDQAIAEYDSVGKELATAQAALTAAQAKQAEAQKAYDAAVKNADYLVRSGTVVWSTANNVPAISRVTQSMTLSIIGEPAPFQLVSEAPRLKVNQSRQILIPVTLEKRNGFDEKVTLTTQGLAKNANIDFPNSAIEKGQATQTLRMFVKDNSPPGVYTVWMNSTGQVAYSRNPAKAERLKQESDQAKAKADEAKVVEQAATAKKNEATAALTKAQQTLQQQQAALKSAEAAMVTSKQTLDTQTQTLAAATAKVNELKPQVAVKEKAAADVAQSATAKATELAQAEKQVAIEQGKLNAAEQQVTSTEKSLAELQKQAADQPDNTELKSQIDATTKTLADQKSAAETLTQSVKTQTDTRDKLKQESAELTAKQLAAQKESDGVKAQLAAASKAADEAQRKAKAAQADLTAKTTAVQTAQTELAKATEAMKAAEAAKTAAEAAEKTAQANAKALEATRAAAEKAATDAANAAKPKNMNFLPPTVPIVVEVLPAPVKLAATVPNGGKVKKGEGMEVIVKVTRQNDFAGPVTLALALPPGVSGVTADPVVVPADQTEGKITVKTTAESPDGGVANVVVRAAADFNGKAEVDAPIALELTK